MSEDYDVIYGVPLEPSDISPWEVERTPLSLTCLDEAGERLRAFAHGCRSTTFENVATSVTLLWAMEPSGKVAVAVEELAELPNGDELTGHPRRRNYPRHPSEEKKLGHPCLVGHGQARIAGELFLDQTEEGRLLWHMNVNSGRYCRQNPPTDAQTKLLADLFARAIGETVELDRIEDDR